MAQVERKSRYLLEYAAKFGPLKTAIKMQKRLNSFVQAGGKTARNFARFFQQSYDRVGSVLSATGAKMQKFTSLFVGSMHRMRNALVRTRFEVSAMGALLAGVLGRVTVGGVKAAATSEDILNRFAVSFSGVREEANAMAKQMEQDLRLSRVTIANYMSGAQDVLVGFGMTRKAALGLSDSVVRLALDLASWNDIPFDEAMSNMLSGLVGNHRALRSMRVVLTQATLERKKNELGIQGEWKQLTEATKVYLRYRVAVEQSVNAIGDLQRTQFETNNRFKFFQEQLKTLSVVIFPQFTRWISEIAEQWAVFMLNNEDVFAELGDYLTRLGSILSKISEHVINFVGKWKELSESRKQLVLFIFTVTSLATPLLGILVIFGRALMVTSIWTAAVVAIGLAIQDVVSVLNGGRGYFLEFLNYMHMTVDDARNMISAFKASSIAFIQSLKHSQTLATVLKSVGSLLSTIGRVIWYDIIPAFQKIWNYLSESGMLVRVFTLFVNILKLTATAIGLVFAVLTGNISRIGEHFQNLRGLIVDIFGGVVNIIVDLFYGILKSLPALLRGLMSGIMNIIGTVLGALTKGFVFVAKGIVKTVFGIIKFLVTSLVKMVMGGLDRFLTLLKGYRKIMPFAIKGRKPGQATDTPTGAPAAPGPRRGTLFNPIPEAELDAQAAGATSPSSKPKGRNGNISLSIGHIDMPVVLPEGFTGDPEELRRTMSEHFNKVFEESLTVAYNDTVGE